MARNQYPGICYRCGKTVDPGAGHFEKIIGASRIGAAQWRMQHAECAIKFRGTDVEYLGKAVEAGE